MNTASEVGYGNVISSLPGFLEVADALLGIGQGMPLFNVALMVNILAGITGSASGGLSIALDIFGQHFLAETAAVGIPAEVVHRIAAMLPAVWTVCPITALSSRPWLFAA